MSSSFTITGSNAISKAADCQGLIRGCAQLPFLVEPETLLNSFFFFWLMVVIAVSDLWPLHHLCCVFYSYDFTTQTLIHILAQITRLQIELRCKWYHLNGSCCFLPGNAQVPPSVWVSRFWRISQRLWGSSRQVFKYAVAVLKEQCFCWISSFQNSAYRRLDPSN